MKALTIIATILISTSILFASNEETPASIATTSISGQVIDKVTGEALAGVKIQLNNSDNTIVYTDLDGNFKLTNLTPGEHEIKSTLISYNTANVVVDCKNKSNNLEIKLDNK